MLAVTGLNTTIVENVRLQRPSTEIVRIAELGANFDVCDHYLFAAGVLRKKQIEEQTYAEMYESMRVNLLDVISACEKVLKTNERARICVIGSESAYLGSHDQVYAVAKAGLHAYVRWRTVGGEQSLTCIAPPIIADSGMTRARHDYPEVLEKRRIVKAAQVAALVIDALYSPATLGRNGVEKMA